MTQRLFEDLEPRLFLSAPHDADDPPPAARLATTASTEVQRGTHNRSRDIFGRDDRTRVRDTTQPPYAAVGLFESWWDDGSGLACTGAMVGPSHVLTSAHCVYDDRDGFAEDIEFTPGFDDGREPFGVVTGNRIRIDANYPYTGYSADDYALVTLTEPVGHETGWFALGSYSTGKFDGMPITSAGYPGDLRGGNVMFTQRGRIEYASTYKIMTKLDVALGQSGSPVYRKDDTIVGVLSSSSSRYTYATRLTARRITRLQRWMGKDQRKLAARETPRANALPFSTTPVLTTTPLIDPLWDDRPSLLA